jgi:hypothetical protein
MYTRLAHLHLVVASASHSSIEQPPVQKRWDHCWYIQYYLTYAKSLSYFLACKFGTDKSGCQVIGSLQCGMRQEFLLLRWMLALHYTQHVDCWGTLPEFLAIIRSKWLLTRYYSRSKTCTVSLPCNDNVLCFIVVLFTSSPRTIDPVSDIRLSDEYFIH